MKKYLLGLCLPLLISACSSTVEIEKKATYKCGNEIIAATFFDDDTMMLVAKGKDYTLTRNVSAPDYKYENIADKVIFWNKNGDNYLEIRGQGYPTCREIVK
jgi:membrane-bound inhibitor of C-type lysozyme